MQGVCITWLKVESYICGFFTAEHPDVMGYLRVLDAFSVG